MVKLRNRFFKLGFTAAAWLLVFGFQEARALSPMVEFQDLVAGQGEGGYEDGPFYSAQFNHPLGLAISPDGLVLYVADDLNNRVREILLDQKNQVETLAGTGEAGKADGPLTTATFNRPQALAALPDGRIVVSDSGNGLLRVIDPRSKSVSTLAGGGLAGATEGEALKVALDPIWNIVYSAPDQCLYFSQPGAGALRRLDLPQGLVETVFKDNPTVPHPGALCLVGGKLFVADLSQPKVYQVQWAPPGNKPGPTPIAGTPTPGSLSLQPMGEAHQVLALGGWGKSLYAYQADPKAPLQRVFPENAPVSFLSLWGTH